MNRRTTFRILSVAAVMLLGGPVAAQVVGLPLPNLPRVGDLLPAVEATVGEVGRLTGARVDALTRLLRANRDVLDVDDRGAPVVRGEVLAISPAPAAIAAARAAGFTIAREERLDDLGLTLVTLVVPDGPSARQAMKRLRRIDPTGSYDVNHIYSGAGAGETIATADGPRRPLRVGLIDGGVAAHPAFGGLRIEQQGFAPGGVAPGAHGTAVASLLIAGADRPRSELFVADVYGTGPTGGSAAAVTRALGWMARERVGVVNVSLVGPPNATLAAAIRAMTARGHLIVAAVGNDGPAARPLYPASYPEVVAVTGVDARNRLLVEASRCPGLDFAAPGVARAAATAGDGSVRGTSFAAPVVAARLAARLAQPDPAAAPRAIAAVAAAAIDLGPRGFDKLYGHGLVGGRGAEVATKNRSGAD